MVGRKTMLVRFQVEATTSIGDELVVVGSHPALGNWNLDAGVRLTTTADTYPRWWSNAVELGEDGKDVQYKYAKRRGNHVEWEADGTDLNRSFSCCAGNFVLHDFSFGTIRGDSFGFSASVEDIRNQGKPLDIPGFNLNPEPTRSSGKVICVLGNSVACGAFAWNLQGWVSLLGDKLKEQYGHSVVNVSRANTDVRDSLERFDDVIPKHNPVAVLISLSVDNEGIFQCAPHERMRVQRTFEEGILKLIEKVRDVGAEPILTGVYPSGDCTPETSWFLYDVARNMRNFGVQVIEWLDVLEDGEGRWKEGLSLDNSHPSAAGHELMYQAIDTSIFDPKSSTFGPEASDTVDVFADGDNFRITLSKRRKSITVTNDSPHNYQVDAGWGKLQDAIKHNEFQGILPRGLYSDLESGQTAAILEDRTFVISGQVAGHTKKNFQSLRYEQMEKKASKSLRTAAAIYNEAAENIFYDGNLSVRLFDKARVQIMNETTIEYNVHPMWGEVRQAMRAIPAGVYVDPANPDADFRTMLISEGGLCSRFKIAPLSVTTFERTSDLDSYHRIALVPVGHRCAIRMILHRAQYDGPCYPFDLTRTSSLADVADILSTDFHDMWNPDLLHYSHEEGRLFHKRWFGLSYAHEVEEGDDPICDIAPVYTRMKARYSKRAQRFRFVMEEADEVFLLRTGNSSRAEVGDMLEKVQARWPQAKTTLFLFSRQPGHEFDGLTGLRHVDMELDPDRMNEDPGYLRYCTDQVVNILQSSGVSSRNLFWCPNNVSNPKTKGKTNQGNATDKDIAQDFSHAMKINPIALQMATGSGRDKITSSRPSQAVPSGMLGG